MVANGNIVRVILADDDEDDCMLFHDIVQELDPALRLTCVANGLELHKELEESTDLPDIVFLDLNMPLKNGMDCLHDLRQDSRFANLPVVILSTSAQKETVARAFEKGADMYVRKPSSLLKLRDVLDHIFAIYRSNDLMRQPWERFLVD